jgi:hypothetical protein
MEPETALWIAHRVRMSAGSCQNRLRSVGEPLKSGALTKIRDRNDVHHTPDRFGLPALHGQTKPPPNKRMSTIRPY